RDHRRRFNVSHRRARSMARDTLRSCVARSCRSYPSHLDRRSGLAEGRRRLVGPGALFSDRRERYFSRVVFRGLPYRWNDPELLAVSTSLTLLGRADQSHRTISLREIIALPKAAMGHFEKGST